MQHYYLVDGTLSAVTRWSPVSPVVTEESSEQEHLLQKEWASRFWTTPLACQLDDLVADYEEHYSLLTEHLPYQEGSLISLLDRNKGKRTSYRPAKAAKLLLPGRHESFYKSFAELLIKPVPACLELSKDYRAAYTSVKSCMSRDEPSLKAVELYKHIPDVSCLVIKSDKGVIVGRSLCCPDTKERGELYLHPSLTVKDVLHLLDGWERNPDFLVGKKLPLVYEGGGILCPYLDTKFSRVRLNKVEGHLLIVDCHAPGDYTSVSGGIILPSITDYLE